MGLLSDARDGSAAVRWSTLRSAPPGELVAAAKARVHYRNEAYGLRRDLAVPFAAPEARLPLTIRPLEERDVPLLLDPDAEGLPEDERHERRSRLRMLRAGLRTPYVAADDEDRPVYVQWLLGTDQNDAIASFFRGTFPRLQPGEALLEGAFTPAAQRGRRIMPSAMAQIAERAVDLGARWVLTFVTQDNAPSLTGCARAGFVPVMTRTTTIRLLRRQVSFVPLDPPPAPA